VTWTENSACVQPVSTVLSLTCPPPVCPTPRRTPTQNLSFQVVVHDATTIDCQPMYDNGVLIQVMGQLKVRQALSFFAHARSTPHLTKVPVVTRSIGRARTHTRHSNCTSGRACSRTRMRSCRLRSRLCCSKTRRETGSSFTRFSALSCTTDELIIIVKYQSPAGAPPRSTPHARSLAYARTHTHARTHARSIPLHTHPHNPLASPSQSVGVR
jgi:hypothetical protein